MNSTSSTINTWKKFARIVRSQGCNLLARLDEFPNSILVTGCQRSGTTMLSRIITRSNGMVNYWFGSDDELDAALILSGFVEHAPNGGRYCFQTTYLNECVDEYYEHNIDFKIVWVLRHPYSVIHSMLYNWKNFALNELFASCGADLLDDNELKLYKRFGIFSISKLKRACMAYCGKISQLFQLYQHIGSDQLIALDYDTLVNNKNEILPKLYQFINLPYRTSYSDMIHSNSLSKFNKLSKKEKAMIENTCVPLFEKASNYLKI